MPERGPGAWLPPQLRTMTIVVNGVSGSHIVTMENVDPAQMTAHDLRERVVSAKGGPAAGAFLQANLSLISRTVNVGPEKPRTSGERRRRNTRTVAEAFNINLRRVPDSLILTAVFSDVAQRVRDACACPDILSAKINFFVKRFHYYARAAGRAVEAGLSANEALFRALQTVADVLGLQLADRRPAGAQFQEVPTKLQSEKNDQGETVRRTGEVDWKQRAVAWRQGLLGNYVQNNVANYGQDNLPLMPGAFRWHGFVRSKDNRGRLTEDIIEIVSVEGAPKWVQEALDACWVAAAYAEESDIREVRQALHYAERDWRKRGEDRAARAQWQFADGLIGGTQ
eukprot:g16881.t1